MSDDKNGVRATKLFAPKNEMKRAYMATIFQHIFRGRISWPLEYNGSDGGKRWMRWMRGGEKEKKRN